MANSFKELLCLCQLWLCSRCWSLAAFPTTALGRAQRKHFVFLTSDYQTKASKNRFPPSLPCSGLGQDPRAGEAVAGGARGASVKRVLGCPESSRTNSREMATLTLPKVHELSLLSFSFMPGENQSLQSSLKVKATFAFHSGLSHLRQRSSRKGE